MRREPGLSLVSGNRRAMGGGLPIVARGLSCVRGTTAILTDIDLTIARGGRTFILGPNGSGKSTLLRMLHGLIEPTRGTVTWNGSRQRPHEQAMVFQRPVLLRRSVESNLRYALSLNGVNGADADRRILEALNEVGL